MPLIRTVTLSCLTLCRHLRVPLMMFLFNSLKNVKVLDRSPPLDITYEANSSYLLWVVCDADVSRSPFSLLRWYTCRVTNAREKRRTDNINKYKQKRRRKKVSWGERERDREEGCFWIHLFYVWMRHSIGMHWTRIQFSRARP